MASFLKDPQFSSIVSQIGQNASSVGSQASDLTGSGMSALAPVLKYFKALAGGDASAVAQATAPQRRRVIDQYDTARKTISQFGPRGGGSNAALAGSQFGQANELSDITANATNNAANELGTLGTQQEGLGLSAKQIQGQDLNSILSAILGGKQIDVQQHAANMQLIGDIFGGVGNLVGLGLTRKAA